MHSISEAFADFSNRSSIEIRTSSLNHSSNAKQQCRFAKTTQFSIFGLAGLAMLRPYPDVELSSTGVLRNPGSPRSAALQNLSFDQESRTDQECHKPRAFCLIRQESMLHVVEMAAETVPVATVCEDTPQLKTASTSPSSFWLATEGAGMSALCGPDGSHRLNAANLVRLSVNTHGLVSKHFATET